MKLSKLYCNKQGFKNIQFNLNGLNIIYADVVSTFEEKKNSHDLGKTKLAELIDFLFLKGIEQKRHFLFKIKDENGTSRFINYIFYLELQLNSGEFLTVRRSVENNSKISFALNQQRVENFLPPQNWIEENIPFERAKKMFSEYISLDFFKNKTYDYRKAISYSLRLQGDYEDVYKLSKYVGGKDIDWKPFMFDLLGFDGELLSKKYENDLARDKIKGGIDNLKKEYSIRPEDRDDIVAQIKLIENNGKNIEIQIDKFNFYEQDKDLINKGIEEFESQISDLNTLSYNLNFEIERIQKSIKNNFSFNLEKVKKVFEESNLYFPDQLKNDYDSLIAFNNLLTIDRNKLLKSALTEKENALKAINTKLEQLNFSKEELLSYLKDTDAFKKFKFYQKELVKVEGELLKLQERLKTIDSILEKERERESLHKLIEATVEKLFDIFQTTENNMRYSDIREKFSAYYKKVMDEDALIAWNINTNNNVEFIPPRVQTKGALKKDTAKDDGSTYKKILCVVFDLAILCSYNLESYYRFVYHDDVLSQQDNGIKTRLLELIRNLTGQYDLQYILSVIKSDLPVDSNQMPIYFSEKEVVLKLHDRNESGTLFGFEF